MLSGLSPIPSKGMMADQRIQFDLMKTEDEQRLVFGLAQVSVTAGGELVTDLQGDQIEPAELEKAFYDFVLTSREGDVMHERLDNIASLCESFVVTPVKLKALMDAIGCDADVSSFRGAAAWVGFKVFDDETWKAVKSGKLRAFSIDGTAERVEVAA